MIVSSSYPQPQSTIRQPDGLQQTIAGLLRIVPADKVFFHNSSLHIVINGEAARSLQQYKLMLNECDWNTTGYVYTLHALTDVCRGLDEGKLLYTDIFQPQRQVYDNGQSVLPMPLPLRLARMMQQSREEFHHGYKRSQGFRKGAMLLLLNGEAELAAFMLHQSVEQLLRGFLLASTALEVKTHTLSDLLKHIRRFAPEICACCGPVAADGRTLISILEKAYVCGRYVPGFIADPEVLELCIHQVALLQETVTGCFHASERVYDLCLSV